MFKIKGREVPDLYDFRTITLNGVADYPNGLKQVQEREIDGIIVKGALTTDEVSKIDSFTRSMVSGVKEVHYHSKGYVYPKPFSSLGNEIPDPKTYFEQTKKVRDGFESKCGVDIEERLFQLLSNMAGGRRVSCPEMQELGGSCIPYGLRLLKPLTGALEVHCGNLFHGQHNKFYEFIDDNVGSYDQLSYFYVVQPSESSDLILFAREWSEGQHKKEFEQMYTFTDENGKVVDCSEYGIDRMTIRLEPGDFLTFAGGPIWHMVDEVKGHAGRITVGGFMGFTHDDMEVQVWS
ncbi:MAG: hypothetical protein GC178_03450 [Flavobacteriales bacterium]|nr:hypothetical protein [Flavobacteriales bacterium]